MLMYTSDGWFFSDISGIETVKILQYAAKAMELCKSVTGIDFQDRFANRLSFTKSNIPKFKNGKVIYEKQVKLSGKQ